MEQEIIIVQDWLDAMTESVIDHNLTAHMALVSQKVRVYGIPGREVIRFLDWEKRRKNEFDKDILRQLTYSGLKITTITERRIGFEIEENMLARNGDVFTIDKDIMLEREADENWRVVEENVTYWQKSNI